MVNAFRELEDALRERLDIIKDHALRDRDPETHATRLREVSARIERLRSGIQTPSHGRLLHYLESASFDKALNYVVASRMGNATGQRPASPPPPPAPSE